jgi:hypothetical protein
MTGITARATSSG